MLSSYVYRPGRSFVFFFMKTYHDRAYLPLVVLSVMLRLNWNFHLDSIFFFFFYLLTCLDVNFGIHPELIKDKKKNVSFLFSSIKYSGKYQIPFIV